MAYMQTTSLSGMGAPLASFFKTGMMPIDSRHGFSQHQMQPHILTRTTYAMLMSLFWGSSSRCIPWYLWFQKISHHNFQTGISQQNFLLATPGLAVCPVFAWLWRRFWLWWIATERVRGSPNCPSTWWPSWGIWPRSIWTQPDHGYFAAESSWDLCGRAREAPSPWGQTFTWRLRGRKAVFACPNPMPGWIQGLWSCSSNDHIIFEIVESPRGWCIIQQTCYHHVYI